MANILGIVITTLVILGVGGGGMYLIWLMTRPKKITWKAEVYQLGEGVKPPVKDKTGKVISNYLLSDLRPYTKDVVEKVEKDPGITIYNLVKLKKSVPAVTNDCVDYWGEKDKRVRVLVHEDSCTLLTSGYDRRTGTLVFRPLPHDRINMIKTEMAMRKDRMKKEKDILTAITPWIVVGIGMMGLVAITYFLADAYIEINDKLIVSQEKISSNTVQASRIIAAAMEGKVYETEEIQKEEPPPSVDE